MTDLKAVAQKVKARVEKRDIFTKLKATNRKATMNKKSKEESKPIKKGKVKGNAEVVGCQEIAERVFQKLQLGVDSDAASIETFGVNRTNI